jgi:hypothetical protein
MGLVFYRWRKGLRAYVFRVIWSGRYVFIQIYYKIQLFYLVLYGSTGKCVCLRVIVKYFQYTAIVQEDMTTSAHQKVSNKKQQKIKNKSDCDFLIHTANN